LKGLCHRCLTSDVELVQEKGQILCFNCFGKLHQGKSKLNETEAKATFEALRKKWEKK